MGFELQEMGRSIAPRSAKHTGTAAQMPSAAASSEWQVAKKGVAYFMTPAHRGGGITFESHDQGPFLADSSRNSAFGHIVHFADGRMPKTGSTFGTAHFTSLACTVRNAGFEAAKFRNPPFPSQGRGPKVTSFPNDKGTACRGEQVLTRKFISACYFGCLRTRVQCLNFDSPPSLPVRRKGLILVREKGIHRRSFGLKESVHVGAKSS